VLAADTDPPPTKLVRKFAALEKRTDGDILYADRLTRDGLSEK
jgi:hypothetical protein